MRATLSGCDQRRLTIMRFAFSPLHAQPRTCRSTAAVRRRALRAPLLVACLPIACLLIVVAAFGGARGARADDAPQISGTVTDAGGAPLANIEVLLYDNNAAYLNRSAFSLAESGYFSFTGLAAGTYRISFNDGTGIHLPAAYNDKADITVADPIAFDGTPMALEPVRLTAAARIGGRVTDEAGNAPGSVNVTLYAPDALIPAQWAPLRTLSAMGDGVFYFGALRAGVYRVGFAHNSTPPLYAPAFFPNPARTLAEAANIVIGPGEYRDLQDVVLARTATITGTVAAIDPAAPGQILACLRAPGESPPPSGLWYAGDCMASDLVDADGSYAINGLQAGNYNVFFFDLTWPPAYFDAPYIDPAQGPPGAAGNLPPTLITLGAGETRAHVDATLRRAGYVAGTARALDGTLLGNLDVRLYRLQGGAWRWQQSARTDARSNTELLGRFTFQTVISGTYTVGFTDPQGTLAPIYHPSLPTLGDATSFYAEIGAAWPNIDGYLPVAGSVAGRVLAPQGEAATAQPLAGAEVSLYLRGNEWLAQTLTDGEGRYLLAGLGVEDYLLRVRDPAGRFAPATSAPFTVASLALSPGAVASGPAAMTDIVLTAGALAETAVMTPTGFVRSAQGEAIADATVTLYKLPGQRSRVAAWEAEPFTCASAASLGAGAVWNTAAPESGAIFAYPEAEGLAPLINPQRTTADGAFGWKLPPGCWFVRVEAPGYYAGVSAVAGAPPLIANLDVVLQPLPATPTLVPPSPTAKGTPSATPTVKASPSSLTPTPTPLAGTPQPSATPTIQPTPSTPLTPSTPATATPTPPRPPLPGALNHRVLLPAVVR